MNRISEIISHSLENVELKGWLANKRSSGGIHFLILRDGSGFIQVIVNKADFSESDFNSFAQIPLESSISVSGAVKTSPKGDIEILASKVDIIHTSTDEFPIGKKEHGVDFLLDNRHLWLRSSGEWAIQRIRNELIYGIYDFFRLEGFIKIDSPIFTPSACEGTTTLFEVKYFDQIVYLSQSGQLYLEAAIAAHGKVFDFGPTFRSEKSKTRRHLTEFWMMDAEMAFFDQIQNQDLQEKMIQFLLRRVLENCKLELKTLERDVTILEESLNPFYRFTYDQVVEKLQELGSDINSGEDLGNDDETMLMTHYKRPLFIESFPASFKAFYMKRDPKDDTKAYCADLLAPEGYGEIIGGSQREESVDVLIERLKHEDLNIDDFQWYLDIRRYGSVPHSGFGLGLERLVTWVCGLEHVRQSIPFPRTIYRVNP